MINWITNLFVSKQDQGWLKKYIRNLRLWYYLKVPAFKDAIISLLQKFKNATKLT